MLLNLALSFMQIGAFSFGGGYAVLAFVQKELIVNQQLITPDTFVNLVAIAQMTPGSMAVNLSGSIGYTLAGVPGGIICPLATMSIPFVLALLVGMFYDKLKDNDIVHRMFAGIRPLAIGIVAAACVSVITTAITSITSILIVVFGVVLVLKFKATPIITVVSCGVLGGVIFTLFPMLQTLTFW